MSGVRLSLAVCPLVGYLTSLSPGSLTSKMGIIIVLEVAMMSEWVSP